MFRESLMRQAKHVQFLEFERKDIADPEDGKLVETTSYFLLANFFLVASRWGVVATDLIQDVALL